MSAVICAPLLPADVVVCAAACACAGHSPVRVDAGVHRCRASKPEDLRSARWFPPDDLRSFGHRSRMNQMGYAATITPASRSSASSTPGRDINPCHTHFKQRVEDVKRGVWQAGGFPVELPAISLSEHFMKPTTMLYRNLLAMEAEELIRSHPVDGAVLMGGCDKTTPGLIMGATSAGAAGDLRAGRTDAARQLARQDARLRHRRLEILGRAPRRQHHATQTGGEMEAGIARSYGICMTMGTASTMTALAEAIGLTLPGARRSPPPIPTTSRMAADCGRRIVEMVWEDLTPASILTRGSVRQRHRRRHGHGRLDQRHHPPDRHGAPRRPSHRRSTTSTQLAARCR